MSTHPFAAGDKIRFNKGSSVFNARFLQRFFDDSEGVVTVTEAVTEPDNVNGGMAHYVRLAEDTDEDGFAPIWNTNWFDDEPVTPAPTTAQEATMTNTREFKVGDKVRVTNERTPIGGPAPSEKGTYVGATAMITNVVYEGEFGGDYHLEFDDKSLSSFGTWSAKALDLVTAADEVTPERPTIDFSGSSRSTAREYAKDANTRLLSSSHQALLRSVGKGEEVDAYALNEALLSAMRATLTRHGASTQRRVTGRKIAYLAHITQAVLENHAQGLPAYETGERSRLLAEVKPALVEAQKEVEAQTERANQFRTRLERSEGERAQFLQAASDERRRLCAEIDAGTEALEEANANFAAMARVAEQRDVLLAETVAERDRVAEVLDYALGLLQHADKQRVLGFWDGRDESRLEAGE
jgi:hypothetical protein